MRKSLVLLHRLTSPATPTLTPEYLIAAATTLASLFLTQGLITNNTEKIISGTASVAVPLAFLVGQAAIKAVHRPRPTPQPIPPEPLPSPPAPIPPPAV